MSVEKKLQDTAQQLLDHAMAAGATSADVVATRSTDFEVKVCDGKIVTLTEAVAKGIGLRVFVDKQLGFCLTSDFRNDTLKDVAQPAVDLAKESADDPHNGLPDAEAEFSTDLELDLYDADIPALSTEEKIRMAHTLEEAARATDPRVKKFRDSGVSSGEASSVMLSSKGVQRQISGTGISLWCNPIAESDGQLQTEVWYDSRTHLEDLESPESVGRIAAQRAARMLGAKPVKTQNVPIILEPHIAAGFVCSMIGAMDGDMVFKKASFLADKLDSTIAVPGLSLIDDPHLVRGTGSAPFDGEGFATYRKDLLAAGTLKTFLYDTYTARKAGKTANASAKRGYASMPHPGTFNVYIPAGNDEREEILASADKALLLTRGMGRGLNGVTGDYSRGANGLWLEKGEVVHPVQEVTIAGDYLQMLQNIDAIGTDLTMRGSAGAPTLRIADVTVSGN
ncbi:MAG: hypothetical protein CMH60_06725 [Myxococcales bacterium]|nr:hypothetical protein [Myxococcales bacterium]